MNPRYYTLIASAMVILGIVVYCIIQNIIIIRSPFSYQILMEPQLSVSKKRISLYFWHNDTWNREEIDLIWSDDKIQTLQYLINSWLTLLDEEKATNKKVTVQSIALTPNGQEAFLSFDRYPFDKKNSAHEKWLWIEGLLKTIRENGINIQALQFLVHHQSMIDYHLDFSKPWPIEGFLE